MKHYIIWLKSGETVSGDIADELANNITLDGRKVLNFRDNEGCVAIKRNRIEAIGINDITETRRCGF